MSETASDLFYFLLHNSDPRERREAVAAVAAAARETRCHRNQPCNSVVGRHCIACVLSGAVRKFALRSNGQRQIVDLLIRGDFLGLGPADPGFLFEAVSNGTRVASFNRQRLNSLGVRFPMIAELIQRCTIERIRRLERHLLIQGRITANEKVRAYLAEMGERIASNGGQAVELPVTRYDIADHLGIAVETVSRTMTALKRRGCIALRTPRHVEIHDTSMLSESSA
jgi:CRP-like cAMP-binding protein